MGWSSRPPDAPSARPGQGSRDRSAPDPRGAISGAPAGLGRPLRVGLYARVSTRERDHNPELQLDAMRDYVRTRGWEAVEYVDTAAAGDPRHQPGETGRYTSRAVRSIRRSLAVARPVSAR
jgi:hypothetical protein